jgi:hypothetical protein
VLNDLSKQVSNCYRHAEDCARQAAETSDPQLRQDFLALEQHWLKLARSYELGERLGDFTKRSKPLGKLEA